PPDRRLTAHPTGPALDVFAAQRADGTLRAGQSINLPHADPGEVAARLPVARLIGWDLLWTTGPPPRFTATERRTSIRLA
ncbi:GNAT family N-acetyltransferase, partial [Micromonospora sp. NPDC005313]